MRHFSGPRTAGLPATYAAALLGCLVTTAATQAGAAEVKAERQENNVAITLDGQPFTEYLTNNGPKPILWPILGPGGKTMTRAFPMNPRVQGERKDHPHHRSLWFTHGDVNGTDYWAEFSKSKNLGKIVHREYVRVESGERAVVETLNDWNGPDGKKQLEDRRKVTLHAAADGSRIIDFDITLSASEGPVKFGDTKEGTFGVRVPTSLDVESRKGGQIVNAEGLTDGEAWGKASPWVDYHGPLDGQTMGVAILNHPSSFRFPTYWHVRTYGLFAANPFGLHDFQGKSDVDGAHTLAQGETITLRYRVIFHNGDDKAAAVAEAFKAYSAEP